MTISSNPELLKLLAEKRTICFAYLFGSCARGKETVLSDVDIAVYLQDDIEHFAYRLCLMEELSHVLKGDRDIDLVVLNEAPLVLCYEVVRDGIVLKDDPERRVEFETRVLREYLDTEPFRAVHVTALKRSFVKERHFGQ